MSEHSPGPWRTGKTGAEVISRDGDFLADVTRGVDARLIAAAPEMLALLRRLSRYVISTASKECPFCEQDGAEFRYGDGEETRTTVNHREHCPLATLIARLDGKPTPTT